MNVDKLNTWIQTLTGIAILAGLGLVVWEIRQNRDATMAQLSSEGYSSVTQLQTSILGEDAARIIAKACDAPAELTREELVVLDNYFSALVFRVLRVKGLTARSGFYGEEDWKNLGPWELLFETPAGRAHFEVFPVGDEQVSAFGSQLLATGDHPDCGSMYDEWQRRLRVDP